ncbi:MAG: hypothetical protein AABX51_04240 [Nanoarchaeota archaeon]
MKLQAQLLLLVLILMIYQAEAVRLSPAIYYLEVSPGKEDIIQYSVSNPERNSDSIVVANKKYSEDPISNYVYFEGKGPNQSLEVNVPNGGSGSFNVIVKIPANLGTDITPGKHNIHLGVSEQPGIGGSSMDVITSLFAVIVLRVPYPGIYIEGFGVDVHDIEFGQTLPIKVTFMNRGTGAIKLSTVNLEIFSENNPILRLPVQYKENVAPLDGQTLQWDIEPKKLPAGEYTVKATLEFDGQNKTAEALFRIGSEDLKLLNMTQTLPSGSIQKYHITVESKWNNPLRDVYADIKILKGEQKKESTKTPFLDTLEPWGKGTLEGFLDTTNLEPGAYDAEITLHYGKKSSKYTTELMITGAPVIENPTPKNNNGMITLIIFGSSIFIIILISMNLYMLFFRKKQNYQNANQKES